LLTCDVAYHRWPLAIADKDEATGSNPVSPTSTKTPGRYDRGSSAFTAWSLRPQGPLRRPVRLTGGPLRAKALEAQDGPDRHADAGAHDEDGRAVCVRATDEPHNGSCRPPRGDHEGRRGAAVRPGQEHALRHGVPLSVGRLLPAAALRTGRGTRCRLPRERRGRERRGRERRGREGMGKARQL